jgi:hypothetical protein
MRTASSIGLIVISVSALLFADTVVDVQGLQYTVVSDTLGNQGAGVKLEWAEPYYYEGGGLFSCSQRKEVYPDYYVIYAEGVRIGTTKDNFFYVFNPCVEVEVRAVWDGVESGGVVLDLAATETPTLEVFSMDDPDPNHPSGFGFRPTGSVIAYSLSAGTDNDKIDYFIASGLKITSPSERVPAINDKRNTTSIETGDYDNLKVVSPCDNGLYVTSRELENGSLYGLWIDPSADGYSTDDHFAKALVTGIDGYKVTLRLSYQSVGGLRWVVGD